VRRTFDDLAIGLQAVVQLVQEMSDADMGDLVTHAVERVGKSPGGLGGPPQWRHRVATGGWIDKAFQISQQSRIGVHRLLAATAVGTYLLRVQRRRVEFSEGFIHSGP
jgi:hypothetical protein